MALARVIGRELKQTRVNLDMDALCNLVSPRARFERHFVAPKAYFYSIDGVLHGKKVQGALFAGNCVLVFAENQREADELATRGLRSTMQIAEEEYRTRDLRLSPTMQGMSAAAAGRKATEELRPVFGREAEQRAKLTMMMRDAFTAQRQAKRRNEWAIAQPGPLKPTYQTTGAPPSPPKE